MHPPPDGSQPVRRRLETELLVLLFGLMLTFALSAIVDPDLPGHIAYGRDHIRDGHLPVSDPYSFTANDTPWVNHEWVFEYLAAWVFANVGPGGLIAMQAVCWAAIGALMLWFLRRSRAAFVPSAVLYLLFAAVAFAAITIRPHLFTYALFAVLLWLLELARTGRLAALGAVPLVFLAWVNVHGGFLAGLCVLSAYAGGLALDALLERDAPGDLPPGSEPPPPGKLAVCAVAATLASFGATLLNPYGTELYAWLAKSLGKDRSQQISEWTPVGLDSQSLLLILMIAVVAVACLYRGRWRQVPLAHAGVLAGTALLAVRHVRHGPFFAMCACAFAGGALAAAYTHWVPPPDEDLEPSRLKRFRVLYGVVLVPALLIQLNLPNRTALDLELRAYGNSPFPTGAIQFLDEHPEIEGNLLVHFDWAQLVIWRYYPRIRVFYDGRFRTVYGPELEKAYFDFHWWEEIPSWRTALDRYPTELVLFKTGSPPVERMLKQTDWHPIYQDRQATLFAKGPANGKQPEIGPDTAPVIPFRPR